MYNRTTMEHFLRPRNAGEVAGGFVAEAKNPDCGDTVRLSLRVDGGRVVEARFKSQGCSGAIASSSVATELLRGRTLDEAAALTAGDVDAALGGLPAEKRGCAEMAAEAARAAAALARGA